MCFPDRGCVHTLLTLYVYATASSAPFSVGFTHECFFVIIYAFGGY